MFIFKQRTASEMRMSDGSSDVCSSDLSAPTRWRPSAAQARAAAAAVLRSSDCSRRSASRSSRRPDPRPPRSKRRTDVQGQAEIIELLNEVLTAELTAINQYFVHAQMPDNWGYGRLASTTRDEPTDEMQPHETRPAERRRGQRCAKTVK